MNSKRASQQGPEPSAKSSEPVLLLSVAPESADQVVLVRSGGRVAVQLRALRGVELVLSSPVFLPKNCRIELELRGSAPPHARFKGLVRKAQLVGTDPSYHLSVRLEDGDPARLAGALRAAAPVGGATRTAEQAPPGGVLPAWTRHLLGSGTLSRLRLEELHASAKAAGVPLEKVLIESQVALAETVVSCMALERSSCYVALDDFDIQMSNAGLVAAELARRQRVFPLFALEGVITLGMSDPTDLALIDQIRLRANCQVDACMCAPEALEVLVARAYGTNGVEPPPVAARGQAPVEVSSELNNGVISLVQALIKGSTQDGASDIHIEPERDELRIRIRVDGILHHRSSLPLEQHAPIVSRLKVLARLDIAETRRPQDGQFGLRLEQGGVDVRVSTIPTVWGENVVLRLLLSDDSPIGLDEIGMPPEILAAFEAELREPNGMLLVTGPTGSGKTTTLYAALARLNTMERNVVTIEDPVEKRLPLLRQTQVSPAAGVTFASGLRSLLRQDPDVIMVGEIRDHETAEIATQAALTGHLVLSTLHTNTAAGALVRLCEVGIPPFLITSSLRAVISQRLARRICQACSREAEPDPRLIAGLGLEDSAGLTFQAGTGCRRCLNTGYKGRIGIYEMLSITPRLGAALLGGAAREAIEEEASRALLCQIRQDGLRQVRAGLITLEELARVVGLRSGENAPEKRG